MNRSSSTIPDGLGTLFNFLSSNLSKFKNAKNRISTLNLFLNYWTITALFGVINKNKIRNSIKSNQAMSGRNTNVV